MEERKIDMPYTIHRFASIAGLTIIGAALLTGMGLAYCEYSQNRNKLSYTSERPADNSPAQTLDSFLK